MKRGVLFSEDEFDNLLNELEVVRKIHLLTSKEQDTEVGFLSSMYQDGVQHGIEGLTNMIRWGVTRAEVRNDLSKARENLQIYSKGENAVEIAYWSGRAHSLMWALQGNPQNIKLFFSAKKRIPVDRDQYLAES